MDVKLGKATINLNPISLNKLLRMLRFYQYPNDAYNAEKIRIQQSIRIKLESLQFEQTNKEIDSLKKNKNRQLIEKLQRFLN